MTINGDLQVSKVPIPQFLFCKGVGIKAQACFIPPAQKCRFRERNPGAGACVFLPLACLKEREQVLVDLVGFEMGMGQN